MKIEHDDYPQARKKTLDKIRLFFKRDYPYMMYFFTLNGKEIPSSKIKFLTHEILLEGLDIPMSENFEIAWFDYNAFDTKLQHPIIDCSIENRSITEQECVSKKCKFNSLYPNSMIPKCYIPKGTGGYFIQSVDSDEVLLKRRDNSFSLFEKEFQQSRVFLTSHKSGIFEVLRIKVFKNLKKEKVNYFFLIINLQT